MATTEYGVNHPMAVKKWSGDLMKEALKRTHALQFMGTNKNALVQIKTELNKDAGDRIRFGLRQQLQGDGISGDGTLEGNEEALEIYTDNVFIDQLRHAVRSGGKMSEQRIPFSVREEARLGLQDWWADRLDEWFFQQVSGSTFGTKTTLFTGNQATIAPDSNHLLRGAPPNQADLATDGSVASATVSNKMSLAMIDSLVLKAKTLSPQIRPVRINGNDHWVLFIHPEQTFDLKQDERSSGAATVSWPEIQRAAMQGGDITGNPLFTGAIGMYNNDTRLRGQGSSGALPGRRTEIPVHVVSAYEEFGLMDARPRPSRRSRFGEMRRAS